MMIARGSLLEKLNDAFVGVSVKETLEQSNCFVFTGDRLIAFNGEVMAETKNPFDFDAVVVANDFLNLISKIPDENLEIVKERNELIVKGHRRKSGVVCTNKITLPLEDIPDDVKWSRLQDGAITAIGQCATICGDDDAEYLATCVHITPNRVEGCDNYRILRIDAPTGFPSDVLIPATSVKSFKSLELTKVAVVDGWIKFRTINKATISVRASSENYLENIDDFLSMQKGESLTLPSNLGEIIERAEIFVSESDISVRLRGGELIITTRKDSGWYKERKKIKYDGRQISFMVNPKFLIEILKRTRDVEVDSRRIKITSGNTQFAALIESDDSSEG